MKRFLWVWAIAVLGSSLNQPAWGEEKQPDPPMNVTVQVLMFHGPVDAIYDLFPDPLGPGRTLEVPEATLKKIREFEMKKKIVVLTRPQVTARSGDQAQVRFVLEFIYPTEYNDVEFGASEGGGGSLPIALQPSSFRTREIGTLLNVTPSVSEDRKWISLTVIPEKSIYQGMRSFKAHVKPFANPEDSKEILNAPVPVEVGQPDFVSLNLTAAVTVASGRPIILAASEPPAEQKTIPQDHMVVFMLTATASAPGDAR